VITANHSTQAIVLGVAQGAGYPQANCQKACCRPAWEKPDKRRKVACLAIADKEAGKAWMIDATPDFPAQLQYIKDSLQRFENLPDSIRKRIHFIHLNHTNPLLREGSPEEAKLQKSGKRGMRFVL